MPKRPSIIFRFRNESRNRFKYRNSAILILASIASFSLVLHLFSVNMKGLQGFVVSSCFDDLNSELHGYEENGIDEFGSANSIGKSEDLKSLLIEGSEASPEAKVERRLPQCIIIGVRKGGTRALLEFLNLHPNVEKASDEVHFFDDDEKYRFGNEWYRKQMPPSTEQQITIEKSPAYFVTDSVPNRIYSMNSSIKLILIVRDPVTRLISDYAQLAENRARRKDRKIASFEKMVLQSDGSVNIYYKPVRTSIYSIYFIRWVQIFSTHQIHIVDGDRLVYDPFPEVQKVEKFLSLRPFINRDNFSYNSTKGFYCVKVNGTLEKCLNESKGRPHPEVDPKVLKNLRKFYAPYNHQFYKMTGINFGWPEM